MDNNNNNNKGLTSVSSSKDDVREVPAAYITTNQFTQNGLKKKENDKVQNSPSVSVKQSVNPSKRLNSHYSEMIIYYDIYHFLMPLFNPLGSLVNNPFYRSCVRPRCYSLIGSTGIRTNESQGIACLSFKIS